MTEATTSLTRAGVDAAMSGYHRRQMFLVNDRDERIHVVPVGSALVQ
jgi:hypothetical protein